MPGNQFEAVTGLMDAEQGATECDLTNQALSFRRIVKMGPSAEQSVVEGAGRLQIAGDECNMIDT
jgi:hypothetical protein